MDDLDLFKSEKLSRAVESLAEAVLIADPGGVIVYVNPAFEVITGYSPAEAMGRNPRILKSGLNAPELYVDMWNTLLRGETWRGNVINKRKDGTVYHARLTISPIWTDTGRIINYVAVQYDVTREVQAEREIRLRTQEYNILQKVAEILRTPAPLEPMLRDAIKAIVSLDELKAESRGAVFFADGERRTLKLHTCVGEFPREFLEKEVPFGKCVCGACADFEETLISHDCFPDTRHVLRFAASGPPPSNGASGGLTECGHCLLPLKSRGILVGALFLCATRNLRERSREILRSIGNLIADAVEYRWREEELLRTNKLLAETNKQLQDLNHLKNEFLSIAAHDLRNPLYLITAYSEALGSGYSGELNENQKKLAISIHDAGKEMTLLLNDLLDLSKIEGGTITLRKNADDFNDLVRSRVELNRVIAHPKGIAIAFTPGAFPPFPFDRNRLIQAIDNLIGNAIKFSPWRGQIHVATEWLGGRVKFSVQDNGPGISGEDQKLLFETFQTLSARPTGGEQSTGLGLSIVKKIILLHAGEVGVSSQLGKGSTFFFIIPCN